MCSDLRSVLLFWPGRYLSQWENSYLEGVPLSKLLSSHNQVEDRLLHKMKPIMEVSQSFQ